MSRSRRASRRAAAILAAAAVLGLLLHSPRAPHALDLGRAPAFRVKDLSGRMLELDTLRRQGPVLLDFWATWCKPCHAAIPELEALKTTYGPQGLTIVGISVDGPRNHNKVRPFVTTRKISYPVVIDQDGRLQQLYQVVALPTAVLIDTAGTIVTARVGFRPGEGRSLGESVRTLLASAPADTSRPPRTEP